jgi:hypothetical protein
MAGKRRSLARWLLMVLLSNVIVVFLWVVDPFAAGGMLEWAVTGIGGQAFSFRDLPFWLLWFYLGAIDVIAAIFAMILLPPTIRSRPDTRDT